MTGIPPTTVDPRLHSWGVFTTAGCDRGRPLLWNAHRARLGSSALVLGAPVELAVPGCESLESLLAAEGLDGPARLRVVARQGAAGWTCSAAASPVAEAGPEVPPVSLAVVRWPAAPPLAGHKSLARLAWDLARAEAASRGADEALLVDHQGRVLETSVANLWARLDDRMLTPPAPDLCLPGIMRGWLLENLRCSGASASVAELSLDEVLQADELWISNAVIGARRVCRLDAAAGIADAASASRAASRRTWHAWPAFDEVAQYGLPAPGWRQPGA